MTLATRDLDAYFARVGYEGPREPTLPVLHALTAAHTQSIPFENLDVVMGRPIELSSDALVDKLVVQRRGGYCFEQNGLFLEVLAALGFAVAPLSARVRIGQPREYTPPRTHVLLRVELGGESFLTDVGVGALSLTSALRLFADGEQATAHETRRIVQEGARWFHQVKFGEEWNDVYEFTLEEMPFIDRKIGNWFTSAHPESHFKNRLLVARALPAGERVSILNDEFTHRLRGGRGESRKIATPEDLLAVLAEHFGLRFPPGTRFGSPGALWPA